MKKKLFLILTMMICLLLALTNTTYGCDVTRIEGADRYETAMDCAYTYYRCKDKTTSNYDAIVIASGKDYPDALSASYLAYSNNSPIFLASGNYDKDGEIVYFIRKRKDKYVTYDGSHVNFTIYVIGGETAVSSSLINRVKNVLTEQNSNERIKNIKVVRFSGRDRYETNTLVLKELVNTGKIPSKAPILVCSGDNFPDAISASAVNGPIILASKDGSEYYKYRQSSVFISIPSYNFYAIGGSSVVSDKVFKRICDSKNTYYSTRVSGKDRYETSIAISEEFFSGTVQNKLMLASGSNYPDGLAGSSIAHLHNNPMLLVSNNPDILKKLMKYTKKLNDRGCPHDGIAFGGMNVISEDTYYRLINPQYHFELEGYDYEE